MLNGSKRKAAASSRAHAAATDDAEPPPSAEVGDRAQRARIVARQLHQDRMHPLAVPIITLFSALVGGASGWLLK